MTDTLFTTAGSRPAAWGVLGSPDLEPTDSPRDAMDAAGMLGWNVHKRRLETASLQNLGDGEELINPLAVPDHYASVATIDGEPRVLGVVGRQYAPIQNEAYLPLFDAVVANEPGAEVVSAGSLRGGARVFVTVKMPALTEKVGGIDPVDMYLVGQNTHDGSSAFHFALTPIRFFCTNQLRGLRAGKGVHDSWSIRHTSSQEQRLDQVRHLLGDAREWSARFHESADRLLNTAMSPSEFRTWTEQLYPAPSEDAAQAAHTRWGTRMDELAGLFAGSATLQEDVLGTAWAGLNAVTEYVDHYAPAGTPGTRQQARAERQMMGRDLTIKGKAWSTLMAAV